MIFSECFFGDVLDRTVGYTPWRLGYTVKNSSLLHQAAPGSFAAPLPLLQRDHSRWSLGTDCGCERPSLTTPGLPADTAGSNMAMEWAMKNGLEGTPIHPEASTLKSQCHLLVWSAQTRCFWRIGLHNPAEPHYSKFRITHKAEAAVDPACLLHDGRLDLRI